MSNWDSLYSHSFLRRLSKVVGEALVDGILQNTIKISGDGDRSFVLLRYSSRHGEFVTTSKSPGHYISDNTVYDEDLQDSSGDITVDSIENYLLRNSNFIPYSITITLSNRNIISYDHSNWNQLIMVSEYTE